MQILDALTTCASDMLCDVLTSGVKFPTILRLLEAFPSGRHRASLLFVLAHHRLPDLSLHARAILIRALASEGRKLKAGSARAIADVLMGTTGADLSRLKLALNQGGGRHDLFRLVYRDLAGSPAAQVEVLQHLAIQAAAVHVSPSPPSQDETRSGNATAGNTPVLSPLHVISDLDDTLRQGWLDSRVPRHMRYPGAGALVRELMGRAAAHPLAACPPAPIAETVGLPQALEAPHSFASMLPPTGAPGPAALALPTASRTWFEASHTKPPTALSAAAVEALAGGWLLTHPSHDDAEQRAMDGMVPPDTCSTSQRLPSPSAPGVAATAPEAEASNVSSAPPPLRTAAARGASPGDQGSLFILTARPSGAFDILRRQTLDGLDWLQAGSVSLLTGSLSSGVSTAAIAEKKAANMTMHLSLWRECRCVFLGDSGQGDAAVAAEVLSRHPAQVLATLIHDVNPGSVTTGDGSHKAALRAAGVFLFNTYAGAAAAAVARGLLPPEAALRVVQAAVVEAQERVAEEEEAAGRNAHQGSTAVGLPSGPEAEAAHDAAGSIVVTDECAPAGTPRRSTAVGLEDHQPVRTSGRKLNKRVALARAYQQLVNREAATARAWLDTMILEDEAPAGDDVRV